MVSIWWGEGGQAGDQLCYEKIRQGKGLEACFSCSSDEDRTTYVHWGVLETTSTRDGTDVAVCTILYSGFTCKIQKPIWVAVFLHIVT